MEQQIETIVGHLGAALMQVAPSDDKIIVGHVSDAYLIALRLFREIRKGEKS